ncbi:MAG: hypothetical protein ABIO58_01130 [Luteimonas sp.]
MTDNDRKPIVHVLPAILTGAAALIAALTTVYINMRGERQAPAQLPAAATSAAPKSAAAPALAARLRLQVDRIAVQHDGSVGTTDWRFAVEADGEPLFVFSQDELDETGGRNVVVPKDVQAVLRLAAGRHARIAVEGWRGSRLRISEGEPDVRGEGVLSASGALPPMAVRAARDRDGAFVFYFSATRD